MVEDMSYFEDIDGELSPPNFLDLKPSDIGIQGVLEIIPLWGDYCISLGLSIDQAKYFHELPQESLRGLLALKYWRDGRCGLSYPSTWRFFLSVIEDRLGPTVAEELKEKIVSDETWTHTRKTVLEATPSEIHLDDISKNVEKNWRSFLTHLGIPLAKIKEIRGESPDDPIAVCFECLVFWQEGHEPCREATWSVLLEALEKGAEKKEYAEKLQMQLFREAHPLNVDKLESSETSDETAIIARLRKELFTKERSLRDLNTVILLNNSELKQKDKQLHDLKQELTEKTEQLQECKEQLTTLVVDNTQQKMRIEDLVKKRSEHLEKFDALQKDRDSLYREVSQLDHRVSVMRIGNEMTAQNPDIGQVAEKPPRNWKDVKCQKIVKCSSWFLAMSVSAHLVAVAIRGAVDIYSKHNSRVLYTIGEGRLGGHIYGIAFVDEENVLISDLYNKNIKWFTVQGEHVLTMDRGGTDFRPHGITVGPDGCIYVCDQGEHSVCVFDKTGNFLTSFGSFGCEDDCFSYPSDLCFARDGFLYIADSWGSRVCVYNKTGTFLRHFATSHGPSGIDATDCGHLVISSENYHKMMIYTTRGDLVHEVGEYGRDMGQFVHIYSVSVDSDGVLYIGDGGNERIQVF